MPFKNQIKSEFQNSYQYPFNLIDKELSGTLFSLQSLIKLTVALCVWKVSEEYLQALFLSIIYHLSPLYKMTSCDVPLVKCAMYTLETFLYFKL